MNGTAAPLQASPDTSELYLQWFDVHILKSSKKLHRQRTVCLNNIIVDRLSHEESHILIIVILFQGCGQGLKMPKTADDSQTTSGVIHTRDHVT